MSSRHSGRSREEDRFERLLMQEEDSLSQRSFLKSINDDSSSNVRPKRRWNQNNKVSQDSASITSPFDFTSSEKYSKRLDLFS